LSLYAVIHLFHVTIIELNIRTNNTTLYLPNILYIILQFVIIINKYQYFKQNKNLYTINQGSSNGGPRTNFIRPADKEKK